MRPSLDPNTVRQSCKNTPGTFATFPATPPSPPRQSGGRRKDRIVVRAGLAAILFGFITLPARADDVTFPVKPTASRNGDTTRIRFSVSAASDVEVAVVTSDGTVVRHLAAGVLGGKNPPPEPLRPGLAQDLTWDGLDDYGRAPAGGPFQVRVRAGSRVTF